VKPTRDSSGFSYVEVMIATVLISVSLVPAMEALRSGLVGSGIHLETVEENYHLRAKLEELLAEPIETLDAAALVAGSETVLSSYTEPAGTNLRRLVYLSRYDGDNADADNNVFTGKDVGLLWVRVEIENTTLSVESLITRSHDP